MSSFLFHQQRPAYLVRLIWIIFEMGGKWPYSCCFMGCCFQDLFNIARRILGQFPSSFFSIRKVNVHVVHPYSRIDTTTSWEKLRFILSDKSGSHMIDDRSIAVYVFASRNLFRYLCHFQ